MPLYKRPRKPVSRPDPGLHGASATRDGSRTTHQIQYIAGKDRTLGLALDLGVCVQLHRKHDC